jgi:hypothetical protein
MSEHGMSCHDRGIMSMYDMTWNLHEKHAMPVSSYMSKGDMGGFWAGRSGGGFSIKKVVASILTNFFMRTIFGITYPHRKNGHAAETHQLFFFLIYSKYKYKYIYIYTTIKFRGKWMDKVKFLKEHLQFYFFCRICCCHQL